MGGTAQLPQALQCCSLLGRGAGTLSGGNARVKGNGAAAPRVYPPAACPHSCPLSWADVCVGTRGASRFSERPCKVENKTAETPLAWTRCPAVGSAQTQLRVPLLFPCCDKAARGGRCDPTPPGPARGTRQQQQRGAHLRRGAGEGAAAGPVLAAAPPRRWVGGPKANKSLQLIRAQAGPAKPFGTARGQIVAGQARTGFLTPPCSLLSKQAPPVPFWEQHSLPQSPAPYRDAEPGGGTGRLEAAVRGSPWQNQLSDWAASTAPSMCLPHSHASAGRFLPSSQLGPVHAGLPLRYPAQGWGRERSCEGCHDVSLLQGSGQEPGSLFLSFPSIQKIASV